MTRVFLKKYFNHEFFSVNPFDTMLTKLCRAQCDVPGHSEGSRKAFACSDAFLSWRFMETSMANSWTSCAFLQGRRDGVLN